MTYNEIWIKIPVGKKVNWNKRITNGSAVERLGRNPKRRINVFDVPLERLAAETFAQLFAFAHVTVGALKFNRIE